MKLITVTLSLLLIIYSLSLGALSRSSPESKSECKAWLVQSIPTDMPQLSLVPGVLSTGTFQIPFLSKSRFVNFLETVKTNKDWKRQKRKKQKNENFIADFTILPCILMRLGHLGLNCVLLNPPLVIQSFFFKYKYCLMVRDKFR